MKYLISLLKMILQLLKIIGYKWIIALNQI